MASLHRNYCTVVEPILAFRGKSFLKRHALNRHSAEKGHQAGTAIRIIRGPLKAISEYPGTNSF